MKIGITGTKLCLWISNWKMTYELSKFIPKSEKGVRNTQDISEHYTLDKTMH